jgi:cytoskeletal protein CcmA (bactofilin family)
MVARERLVLGEKARVNGNVHYGVIEMASGAVITGKLIPLNSDGKSAPAAETQIDSAEPVAAAKSGA